MSHATRINRNHSSNEIRMSLSTEIMLPLEIISYISEFGDGREACYIRKYVLSKECSCRNLSDAVARDHLEAMRRYIRIDDGLNSFRLESQGVQRETILRIGYIPEFVDLILLTNCHLFFWSVKIMTECVTVLKYAEVCYSQA